MAFKRAQQGFLFPKDNLRAMDRKIDLLRKFKMSFETPWNVRAFVS